MFSIANTVCSSSYRRGLFPAECLWLATPPWNDERLGLSLRGTVRIPWMESRRGNRAEVGLGHWGSLSTKLPSPRCPQGPRGWTEDGPVQGSFEETDFYSDGIGNRRRILSGAMEWRERWSLDYKQEKSWDRWEDRIWEVSSRGRNPRGNIWKEMVWKMMASVVLTENLDGWWNRTSKRSFTFRSCRDSEIDSFFDKVLNEWLFQ